MPDPSVPQPSDAALLAGIAGGDPAMLRLLMDRYDRLVRYTVYRMSRDRCRRDPLWLDSIASEVWSDVCRSARRSTAVPITHVHSYFIQISRRRCIDALRRRGNIPASGGEDDYAQVPDTTEDTSVLLARMEELAALRDCVARLPEADRALWAELDAITAGRWREAAARMGMPESTLRSRWKKVLERLRTALQPGR